MLVDLLNFTASREDGEGGGGGRVVPGHRVLLCNVPNNARHAHASTLSISAREREITLLLTQDVILYRRTFLATCTRPNRMEVGLHGTPSSS